MKVILAGVILTLAAIGGGLAYYELHQDYGVHSMPAAPNGDINVQVHQNDLERTVTVSGNATAGKGLSGVEVEVYKNAGHFFDETKALSGKTSKYSENFDATKVSGNYTAIAKIKDKVGRITELTKDFVLSPMNQLPIISSWGIQSNSKQPLFYVNANDDVAVNKIVFELYNNKTGTLAFSQDYTTTTKTIAIVEKLDFSSVPEGDYTARIRVGDNQGKFSPVLEKLIEVPN